MKIWKVILGILVLFGGVQAFSEGLMSVVSYSGVILLLFGLASLIASIKKKESKKMAINFLLLGFLIVGLAERQIEIQLQEEIAIAELQQKEAEERKLKEKQEKALEEAILAVEAAETSVTREDYDNAYALVGALSVEDPDLTDRLIAVENILVEQELLQKTVAALDSAEKKPTRQLYTKAETLVLSLSEEDADLGERLLQIEGLVVEREKQLEEAVAAVELAESEKSRDSYTIANDLIAALPETNTGLKTRLTSVDEEITAAEKELAEKQKAEEERIAKEKAETEAKAASANNSTGQNSGNENNTTTNADQTQTVYVTRTGKKYHSSPDCRGLNNSNSTRAATLSEALGMGLEPCKFSYPQ